MAALITDATGIQPEVVEGDRGEFTVWVDGELVGRKEAPDQEISASVKRVVAR